MGAIGIPIDSGNPQMRSADSILKINLRKDSIYARDIMNYQPTDFLLRPLRKILFYILVNMVLHRICLWQIHS